MTNNKNLKFVFLLAATLFFVVAAAMAILGQSPGDKQVSGAKFLPSLQDNVDKVETIILRKGESIVTIRKVGDKWLLPGKYNYPVGIDKVRQLVVNAQQIQIVEKKTNDPNKHDSIGLKLDGSEKSPAIRVTLADATQNNIYADFIRGYRRGFGNIQDGQLFYVRNFDDNQTWLAQGEFAFHIDSNSLIHNMEYKIKADRILQVSVYPPVGEDYIISKIPTGDFIITMPADKNAVSPTELKRLGSMLDTGLLFTDVAPSSKISFNRKSITKLVYKTYDGLSVQLKLLDLEEDGVWAKISAYSTDPSKENEANNINLVAKDWVYRVSDTASGRLTASLDNLVE